QESTRVAGLTTRVNKAMAEQTLAAAAVSKAVDDSRKQSEQLARAMAEQARAVKDLTSAAQNISKQVGLMTRANLEHSKNTESVLESFRNIRRVTAQNSEGARNTLRGTRNLLDTVEALVADMNSINGGGNKTARKSPGHKQRLPKNGR